MITAKSGSPPHSRAVRVHPLAKLFALLQHFRATRQVRPHGQTQHLSNDRIVCAHQGGGAGTGSHRGNRVRLRHAPIPVADGGQQFHVASHHLHPLEIAIVERPVPAEDVGRLSDQQPQIREFDGDVLEAEQRPGLRGMALQDVAADLERRERHATLDPSMKLDELEVHVNGFSEFRMAFLDRAERGRFTRVGTRGPGRTLALVSHVGIIHNRFDRAI